MASIGSYAVTAFKGRLHAATRRVGAIEAAAGVDGQVVIRSGWSSRPDIIPTSVSLGGGYAAAKRLQERYRALHGEVVPVIDQFGESWTCTVLAVTSEISATVFANVYRVEAVWQLLTATEQP